MESHTSSKDRGRKDQLTTTLERGLRVLQCFDSRDLILSNSEISKRTNLPKATVSRLTHTLVRLGYLRLNPENGQFILGIGVLSLGYPLNAGMFLKQVSSTHLKDLAQKIDGTATISVRDHLRIVSLKSESANDVLKRSPGIGLSLPFCGSTAGLAWLIGATEDERKKAIQELHYHSNDVEFTSYINKYKTALRFYIKHGYIVTHNLVLQDTSVYAKHLHRKTGEELLLLSCAVSTRDESIRSKEGAIVHILEKTAENINTDLKKTRPPPAV